MSKFHFALSSLCLAAISGSASAQWTEIEEAKLVASDAASGDHFGTSVDLDGDLLVVGAPGAGVGGFTDAGAAYVFAKGGAGWSEIQKLTPLVPLAGDGFGTAVAIDTGRILIGAPYRDIGSEVDAGAAEVFAWNGASWVHAQELTATTPRKDQGFGVAVALDDGTALCGAPYLKLPAGGSGEVFVFVESLGSWSNQATLSSSGTNIWNKQFGFAVALDGERAAVGAPNGLGYVSVFLRSAGIWSWQDVVTPRLPSWWQPMEYGKSVAVSGDSILAGAPWDLILWWTATGAHMIEGGSAQLHEPQGTKWVYSHGFKRNQPLENENYGDAVALDGNLAAMGGPNGKHGMVFVHSRSGSTWKEVAKIQASDKKKFDRFGDAVALEGERVVVGAPLKNPGGISDAGGVYVYAMVSPPPAAYCTAGTSASGCTPTLSTVGPPSASAPSGFTISAAGVEGSRPGILIYGTAGKQALPWGSGTSYLCIMPPLSRSGALAGTGTLGNCDGSFAVDLNALWCPACPKAGTNPGESAGVQAQFWYRDPLSTSSQTTSLTDAVQLWVGP